MIHPKLSEWLEVSSKILQARTVDDKNNMVFIEELNLRRELISHTDIPTNGISETSILGTYQIVGANSITSETGYVGLLSLSFSDNRIYATWFLEKGEVQTGYGLLLGNVLSLTFFYESEGKEYSGLVSYEFLSEKIISGKWVEEENDEQGIELGRKLPVEKEDPLDYFGIN